MRKYKGFEMSQLSGNAFHPIEILFQKIKKIRYPEGVIGTWSLVKGPEFFPGGCGLWNAKPDMPWPLLKPGCILVLGHNLDSVKSYEYNLKTGGIMRGPTWANLRRLFTSANISFDDLFLTNFFMGLGLKQLGAFPGAADERFVADCLELLLFTIQLLKPRAIIVLGGHTRKYIANISNKLKPWSSLHKFDEMDNYGFALLKNISIHNAPVFNVVNIVHPSGALMGNNQRKRYYNGLTGFDAEVALVSDAVERNQKVIIRNTEIIKNENELLRKSNKLKRTIPSDYPIVRKNTNQLSHVNRKKIWRLNTDRNARTDIRTYDLWYHYGTAMAGDLVGHKMEHALVFQKLLKGDNIFMHHSGLGLIGFGEVLEDWDGKVYTGDDRLLYIKEIFEYRIKVLWKKEYDCRNRPVSINGLLPYMGTYSEVNPNKWCIIEVAKQLAFASSTTK